MDNPIKRLRGLFQALSPVGGRNDRKAQRAGEIAPAGTWRKDGPRAGRRQDRRERWLKSHTPPPEPKFKPGRKRPPQQVRIGAHHRLVIPR